MSEDAISTAIDKLRQLGGAKLVAEMVDIYLAQAPTSLADSRAAFARGDLPALAKSVHTLKSTANHVGAASVNQLARQIEAFARANQGELIEEMLSELEAAHSDARLRFEAIRRETV